MVPLIDMVDHNPDHKAAWTTGRSGDKDFQLITHTGVPKVGSNPDTCRTYLSPHVQGCCECPYAL